MNKLPKLHHHVDFDTLYEMIVDFYYTNHGLPFPTPVGEIFFDLDDNGLVVEYDYDEPIEVDDFDDIEIDFMENDE